MSLSSYGILGELVLTCRNISDLIHNNGTNTYLSRTHAEQMWKQMQKHSKL